MTSSIATGLAHLHMPIIGTQGKFFKHRTDLLGNFQTDKKDDFIGIALFFIEITF